MIDPADTDPVWNVENIAADMNNTVYIEDYYEQITSSFAFESFQSVTGKEEFYATFSTPSGNKLLFLADLNVTFAHNRGFSRWSDDWRTENINDFGLISPADFLHGTINEVRDGLAQNLLVLGLITGPLTVALMTIVITVLSMNQSRTFINPIIELVYKANEIKKQFHEAEQESFEKSTRSSLFSSVRERLRHARDKIIDVRKDYKETCRELNNLYTEFSETTKTMRLARLRFLEGNLQSMNRALFDYAEVCSFY